jgi:hypothetical protein
MAREEDCALRTLGIPEMKESVLRIAVGLALLSAGGIASAVQYTWNFGNLENGSSVASTSNGISVSTDGGSFIFKSTSGDKLLTVRAYETGYDDGTGKLSNARVTLDKNGGNWGLGVRSDDDTTHPENVTVDNANNDDVLVFDAGMDNFDWSTLNISYITGTDSSPELKYWAGNANNNGSGGTDFSKLCLTGTCSSGTLISATGSGFSSGKTVSASSTVSLTEKNTGRYLVVSGQLPASGGFEKFKISSGGGYGHAPEPQSMALIGIGLVAMLGMRRRSSNAKARGATGFA